jgi:hypothetical protein
VSKLGGIMERRGWQTLSPADFSLSARSCGVRARTLIVPNLGVPRGAHAGIYVDQLPTRPLG